MTVLYSSRINLITDMKRMKYEYRYTYSITLFGYYRTSIDSTAVSTYGIWNIVT